MELSSYIDTLRRHFRLIIVVPVVCALLALGISFLLEPTYEAEAQLAIVKSSALINFDPKYQTVAETDSSIDPIARRRGLISIAKSDSMASTIIATLGNKLDKAVRTPEVLLSNIDVVLDGDLIRMKARASDPTAAALLANTWADNYQSQVNDLYGESALTPAEVQIQAKAARSDYDQAETALVGYLGNNSIELLSRQVSQKQARLSDLTALDNKLQNLIGDANTLKSKLSAGGSSGGSSDVLARAVLEVFALNTSASLPSNGSGSTQAITLQLAVGQLNENLPVADQLRSIDALITTLTDRQKAARAETTGTLLQEINQLQVQLEQQAAKKQDLTRNRDLAYATLSTVLSKVAEVTLAAQSKGTVVRLASTAVAPVVPVAPRKSLNTLLGGSVGLLFILAIVLLRELTRQTVRNEDEVTTLLKLKTLGAIPQIVSPAPQSSQHGKFPVIRLDAATVVPDAFHLLRQQLLDQYPKANVILVTSPEPLEGKSTIAANLAAVLAESGRLVTLIDANFRHPTLHQTFGQQNERGLAEILSARSLDADFAGQQTGISQLRVISAGMMPPNPAGLLSGATFEKLVERLKDEGGIVIIDAPAALSAADAAIMARVADVVLLVVASDQTPIACVQRASEALAPGGGGNMVVVLNHSAPEPVRFMYGMGHKPSARIAVNGQKS